MLSFAPVEQDLIQREDKQHLPQIDPGEGDFLLIDEPTNHLDAEAREIVKKYLASKKGYILVSHDRDLLDACTDFVSAPAAALILLSIGYDLVLNDIPWKDALSVVGLRLAIMAVLGTAVFFALRLLFPELRSEAAVILMFLLPPPFVLPVFAAGESQRTYVSASLSLSTLVSILGFAILAMLGL